ncbi:glycosyltransferase [Taklimakanibacter deserti]|uniref:glycosyltransferase n=1 Tax=Taklimakanibacter deserti TaxID=2267839 RepID=UPI0034D564C7
MRTAQSRSPDLSLVISSLDEGRALFETICSVYSGSLLPLETIIVDDGGTDDSCTLLRQDDWRARGVKVHGIERSGIAAARNIGGSLATGDKLVFLDAHCRLDGQCLAELDAILTARPGTIVVPAICDFGSTLYGCGARLIDAQLRIRWIPVEPESKDLGIVPIAPGGCLAMARSSFDHLGGFGVFRELGQEDVEFSLRAWRAGVDILAVPTARLEHRFRPMPPYPLNSASRAYNVARVALIHFDGPRREECLRRIIGTPRAAEVLVDAFASDWEAERARISAICLRTAEAYFRTLGDWR